MSFFDRKIAPLLVAILLLSGCQENRQSAIKPDLFFDLDSLLDAQVRMLSEQQYTLTKSVRMDGKEEKRQTTPDSAGWATELIIIKDFDLNKPTNVGAYKVSEEGDAIRYELTADIDAPVKNFEVISTAGHVSRISSNYFEDKSIYQHRRNLTLEFEEGRLKAYEVKGFQKMILKDTISYIISGKVERNE